MKTEHNFKRLPLVVAGIFLILYACNQKQAPNKHSNWADSTFSDDTTEVNQTNKPEELCFAQPKSTQVKDSSLVKLSILGNKVSGKLSWIPFEKDSRTGSINGVKKGDTIDVVWSFTQEGVQDTLRTVFLLQKNSLKQKPFAVNQENGRQFTDNRSDFTITYQKINCK